MTHSLGISIALLSIGLPAIIVLIVYFFSYLEKKKRYESVIEIAKHVQDESQIDKLTELMKEPEKQQLNPKQTGIVLSFTGIGIYVLGFFLSIKVVMGSGVLVSAIGIGIFLAGFVFSDKKES